MSIFPGIGGFIPGAGAPRVVGTWSGGPTTVASRVSQTYSGLTVPAGATTAIICVCALESSSDANITFNTSTAFGTAFGAPAVATLDSSSTNNEVVAAIHKVTGLTPGATGSIVINASRTTNVGFLVSVLYLSADVTVEDFDDKKFATSGTWTGNILTTKPALVVAAASWRVTATGQTMSCPDLPNMPFQGPMVTGQGSNVLHAYGYAEAPLPSPGKDYVITPTAAVTLDSCACWAAFVR